MAMNINYVHVEEGSQFYTDLSQLLQTMKNLKADKKLCASKATGRYNSDIPLYDELSYIIKGLENTIERGYKIYEPVPEGYQRIDVLEGSYVVPPAMTNKIPFDLLLALGHKLYKNNGMDWPDKPRPYPDLSNMEDLLRYAQRQTMESLSETNRVRGLVTPPYCQDFKQKQALIDIIKDDERDNLYDIPRCGECNEFLTLVRPGKWQCDHCGF